MELWFENKVALVTGAGNGIGQAAALLFAQRGAKVVVTDINREAANNTASLIKKNKGQAIACDGDVTDETVVAAFVDASISEFGRLDCAFNNAGICLRDDADWNPQSTRSTIDVNLIGVMNCIRLEIPALLKNGGGTIVNTASLAGFIASRSSFQPAYTASKHAVIGMTKSAALQYARNNIRVNALCPGATQTSMIEEIMDTSPEIHAMMENLSPMGRLASPEEMAEVAIWLCSEKSSFVNGHAMVVDGGALAE